MSLVEVLLAIVLLGATSMVLFHLMRDFARAAQRSEFEAHAASRCESAMAMILATRNRSTFDVLVRQLDDDRLTLRVVTRESDLPGLYLVSVTARSRYVAGLPDFSLSRLLFLDSPS